ncbi:HAD-IC family P-type ATPase [Nocardioides ferulae]|uniref:HAD-IC family P-type ATPase n=1 Tax=Nocardioides ferulae TaxID=2340821 RepID=UPI00197D3382|nr:HAD-IC family P-type ATPase [Nocardioides ferulae]
MTERPAALPAQADQAPHAIPVHEVVLLLQTDPAHGLAEAEAERRLHRYGPNTLPEATGDSLLKRIALQFHNPLIYVLLVAAVVTAALAEYVDSTVILAVVLVNAAVGFVQESRALAALESLREMTGSEARVVRAGHPRTLPSDRLVPGDLVLLEAGDKVPADLRLLRGTELKLDESALTGESLPVAKDEVALPVGTRVADRHNMLYAGTLVSGGTGAGIVVETGASTELGEIHRLVGDAEVLATPLTRKLAKFSRTLTYVILGLAAATFAVGIARGEAAADMFTAAVALAVGAIPEGLPAAVTIALAIGVARMVRRQAIVRRLPAVETLGSTTVICTDKTGTLTENQMTVRRIWTADREVTVTGSGYRPEGELVDTDGSPVQPVPGGALWSSLVAGAACNDAALAERDGEWVATGDPTELAMLVVGAKAGVAGLGGTAAMAGERVAEVPFDATRQYMATLHRTPDGHHVVHVKGGAEAVLERCHAWRRDDGRDEPLDEAALAAVHAAVARLAGEGLRVLATATVDLPAAGEGGADEAAYAVRFGADHLGGPAVLTGLQAMQDPPRPAARTAIEACHGAGIEVKMITGDHAVTAAAIADELGLDHRPPEERRVLTGVELSALPPEEYADAVAQTAVFARVSPEEKLRLVEALQARGHVVAMTGDGVNDAPALRQADIGIAMGRGGTEVAKDAADMVLVDDDFATIEAAVEEGRGVFDNLTKFIVWTLPTNMGEGMVILVAIALGAALPILPTQILWINMTTAVLLGLTLAFEPKEPGVMGRPPRPPDRPLMTGGLVWRTVLVSLLLVAASWWLYDREVGRGSSLAEARTAAVNVFVAVEAAYLISCRALTRPSWRLGPFTNRILVLGVLVQAAAQALFTYTPAMNDLFGTAPIGLDVWWRIGVVVLVASAVVALDKKLAIRRDARVVAALAAAGPTAPGPAARPLGG